jgi:hypothetical protein
MNQIIDIYNQYLNPHNPDAFYRFGRTVDTVTNGSIKNFMQLACNLQGREGIINVVINNGMNAPQVVHQNPEVYKTVSEFKYNLFDSHYTNIVLID